MKAAGAWVFSGGLHPPDTATVLRPQGDDAEVLTFDGPYLEGKEHLGGFTIIEAPTSTLLWDGDADSPTPRRCRSRSDRSMERTDGPWADP